MIYPVQVSSPYLERAKTAYNQWAYEMGLSGAFERLDNREIAAWCAAIRALDEDAEDESDPVCECGRVLTCQKCDDDE